MEQTADSLLQNSGITEEGHIWIWLFIAIGIIILLFGILLLRKRKESPEEKRAKKKLKEQYRHPKPIMENIVNDIFNSKPLYDALSRKCHPDRFPKDPEKRALADKLMQEITRNRTNTKRLRELKEQAEKELDIKIS